MRPGVGVESWIAAVSIAAALVAGGASAETAPEGDREAASERPRLEFGFEAKAHFRDSDEIRQPVNFPFAPEQLPPGQERGFMSTVDPGRHFEISVLTLFATARWSPGMEARAKVDLIDLHDRNPTSSGDRFDVDELWIRFGRESEPALLPERPGAYVRVGKFPKFERQDDRHLESYGLVTTAFSRFEDIGVELGADLGRYVYLRASLTRGNPLFMRDPNALAGDNGTDELRQPNPHPALGTGIPILYDANVGDLGGSGDGEIGLGLGLRLADAGGVRGVDLLAWGYERTLEETVDLAGTFYGGDLDLLRGPGNAFPYAIDGETKRETGVSLWLYLGGFSLFAEAAEQELAGLERRGFEVETAWRFDLPVKLAAGGRQLFGSITPAARFSRLTPDFSAPRVTPSPSFSWPWDKLDLGLRLAIVDGVDLTAEWTMNEFTLASGARRGYDETLVTLRWRFGEGGG